MGRGRSMKTILVIVLIGALCASGLLLLSDRLWAALSKPKYEFQKGMCYVTYSPARFVSTASDNSLKEMTKTGAKWVAIATTWYQDRRNTTDIYPTEKTPNDLSMIHAIQTAHSLGMKVMIKPHLDISDTSDGSWRGEICCVNDADWKVWFESYQKFIVHYAKMAQENNVELFCIGTELVYATNMKPKMWREYVIKPVKEVYKGPLTYAANWDDEYNRVKFWNELDYIGIDAYFPLSEDNPRPTLEEIKKGWEPWLKDIEELQAVVNKPVIFPEVGYCSAKWTTKQPYEEVAKGEVDLQLQADCYTALLETFWNKEWFYGVYWWKWGTDVKFGGPGNRGYYLQNKPSQKVVASWYKNRSVSKKKKYEQ